MVKVQNFQNPELLKILKSTFANKISTNLSLNDQLSLDKLIMKPRSYYNLFNSAF